jgi:hypothetical protein
MCHLPHLRKFTFSYRCISLSQVDTSGFQHILNVHSNRLRELEFGFYLPKRHGQPPGTKETRTQKYLSVVLPRLESLTLGAARFLDMNQIVTYLRMLPTSLTTLRLTECRFSYDEVETFVNAFAGRDRLRSLHLDIEHLNPSLFDLLARSMPDLDRLHLALGYILFNIIPSVSYPLIQLVKVI